VNGEVFVPAVRQEEIWREQRESMVQTQLAARGIRDLRVLDAMRRVPRHEFVDAPSRSQAYEDRPLPTLKGQTISQPYIVAFMLEALKLQEPDRVLEVGTGSGYTAALLSDLVAEVYGIERHPELDATARATLKRLGYAGIHLTVGDGTLGWPAAAPFDAILVSAATEQIPVALTQQLGEGGRLVIPVGPAHLQELQLVTKHEGQLLIVPLAGCRFVPLISDENVALPEI
jgi:protein-L-isoaspartate(D-aspartate) O-methyltransferase